MGQKIVHPFFSSASDSFYVMIMALNQIFYLLTYLLTYLLIFFTMMALIAMIINSSM